MSRRPSQSIVANPVLVGAVTTLVVVVAVFLSYNANSGLPFVPTRQLKVELPNGANLLPGNEVREGGYRIGIVDRMRAVPLADGTVGAEVTLKLDRSAGEIPRDSTVSIRPRSVLGLKYVELTRGRARATFREGETMPVGAARIPVELDELYNIFDERTRDASRENLKGFGNTFAARGASLNDTIAEAPRFFEHLEPVMETLADRRTRLDLFFKELGDAARVVAPIAGRYAHSFAAGADTFEAWSRDEQALEDTISKSAPTLDTGISSLRVQRPFLARLRDFSANLERASAQLPRTLPRITPALEEGTPVLRRSDEVNRKLEQTLGSLERLASAPTTNAALRGLTATAGTLNPLLRFVGPYITVCNYFNYAWTHAAEHLTELDPTGTSQRSLLNQSPRQKNSIGSIGATEPANGEEVQSGTPVFLHSNVYSAAITQDGAADCESGQRGYIEKAAAYVTDPKVKIVTDPHIPGAQGPTFTGRARVPKGQTFTRKPTLGPAMPKELDP